MSKHAAPHSIVVNALGIVNRRVIYVVIYHTLSCRLNKHTRTLNPNKYR